MCNGEADMWIGLDYMHHLTHPGEVPYFFEGFESWILTFKVMNFCEIQNFEFISKKNNKEHF